MVPRVGLGSLTSVRLMRKHGMCVFKEKACPPLLPFQNLLKYRLQLGWRAQLYAQALGKSSKSPAGTVEQDPVYKEVSFSLTHTLSQQSHYSALVGRNSLCR